MDDKSRRMYFLRLLSFQGLFMGSLVGWFAPGRCLVIFGGVQDVFGEDLAGFGIRGRDAVVMD